MIYYDAKDRGKQYAKKSLARLELISTFEDTLMELTRIDSTL